MRRPESRHQRTSPVFREGTRIPSPINASAEPRSAITSWLHSAPVLALEERLHQRAADAVVLSARVDGDRPDAGDDTALVDERAPDQLAVTFGHEPGMTGARDHGADQEARELGRRRLDRQIV